MDVENYDLIIDNLQKIKIYAELMCNSSSGTVEFDGQCIIRMGTDIIESLNIIHTNLDNNK